MTIILPGAPAVAGLGKPETTNVLATPVTSINVPKFVTPLGPLMTPVMPAVPDLVMLPLAKGVPAVGRTRTFCQVNLFFSLLLLLAVMVIVMLLAVTVAGMVEL